MKRYSQEHDNDHLKSTVEWLREDGVKAQREWRRRGQEKCPPWAPRAFAQGTQSETESRHDRS